ncbi:hypothetical protein [Burkholderia pseudomallei]|uniref:hypothetical protein n=1 Tax=Burkholderia pseudomallei TaxID=28450 RepID=UPI00050F6846|nr:hypothetical protein [Burkholderia pseudomallei]KGD47633.1 hypothetical protein DO72_6479 [Burkholderia pseudomallei]
MTQMILDLRGALAAPARRAGAAAWRRLIGLAIAGGGVAVLAARYFTAAAGG